MALTGVGCGQSLIAFWLLSSSGTTLTPNSGTFSWNRGSSQFVAPPFDGQIAFCNTLQELSGEDIYFINSALGSTALTAAAGSGPGTYWLETGPGSLWQACLDDVASSNRVPEFFVWDQGTADANADIPFNTYLAAMQDFYVNQVQQEFPDIPFIILPLGSNGNASKLDRSHQNIRRAQRSFAEQTANVFIAPTMLDLDRQDEAHYTAPDFQIQAARGARAVWFALGNSVNYIGPTIDRTESVSPTQTDLIVKRSGGAGLTPQSGITSVEISTDNFNTIVANDSVELITPDRISVTHAALDPIRQVRYLYGRNPDNTGAVHDNSAELNPLEWFEGGDMEFFGNKSEVPLDWVGDENISNLSTFYQVMISRQYSFLNSTGALPVGGETITKAYAVCRTSNAVDAVLEVHVYQYDPTNMDATVPGLATTLLATSDPLIVNDVDLGVREFTFSTPVVLAPGVDVILVVGCASAVQNPKLGYISSGGSGDSFGARSIGNGDDPFNVSFLADTNVQSVAWAPFSTVEIPGFTPNKLMQVGVNGVFYSYEELAFTRAEMAAGFFSNQYAASIFKTGDVLLLRGSDGAAYYNLTVDRESRDVSLSVGLPIT